MIKQNQSEVGHIQFSVSYWIVIKHLQSYILQKTPLKLNNQFKRYQQLKSFQNRREQKEILILPLFDYISTSIFPTSDWFCLITWTNINFYYTAQSEFYVFIYLFIYLWLNTNLNVKLKYTCRKVYNHKHGKYRYIHDIGKLCDMTLSLMLKGVYTKFRHQGFLKTYIWEM